MGLGLRLRALDLAFQGVIRVQGFVFLGIWGLQSRIQDSSLWRSGLGLWGF